MKKIIVTLVAGFLIAGTVAWYVTSVYARGGRDRELNSYYGKGYGYTQMLETRSETLEMTADELQKELDAGKTIGDIAKEKGLTPEEFHQRMLSAEKKRLENLIKAGILTQEQLETRIRLMEQRYADCDCNGNCDGNCDKDRARNRIGYGRKE